MDFTTEAITERIDNWFDGLGSTTRLAVEDGEITLSLTAGQAVVVARDAV